MSEVIVEHIDSKKLRGGYYTPKPISDFICRWAITDANQFILEPSCGDGNFIESAVERLIKIGANSDQVLNILRGVELLETEAEKARRRLEKYNVSPEIIVNSDFFSYVNENPGQTFGVVIGNPPFIRYQNFPPKHRDLAFEKMREIGLQPNKLTNIWVPFLVVSASMLSENGKLGMVIPAELFQVKYAAETRIFLSNYFERVTIVTFKELVFNSIQQEVVLLLCEKRVIDNRGIRVVEINSTSDLDHLNLAEITQLPVKELEHNSEKWTKYFLDEDEILFLRRLKADNRIGRCSNVMDVDVGIVTGRNEFFMLNEDAIEYHRLENHTLPVVGKSNHLKGLFFTNNDFVTNSEAKHHGYLFLPPNEDFEQLPEDCKEYIKFGESQGYNAGYKTRIRKRWYITPSLWVPSGFALRQVSDYPKIIINQANASSTDTIHRVRFKEGADPERVSVSFLNSLTFAFSEITGRSYGGGVLTFEPSEIEELPLPLLNNITFDLRQIDTLLRNRQIDQVLDIVDRELLVGQLNFTQEEVDALRRIWKKLANRRMYRSKKRLL